MRRSPAPVTADVLGRVVAFVHENLAKTADELRPIEAGCVISTPSLPAVWSVNQIRVALPLGFESVIELAEQQLPTMRYVHIVTENQETGPDLEEAFRAARWKAEREVWMILAAESDRVADTSAVVDADEDEVTELMRRWFAEDELDDGGLSQLVEFSRRESRACGDRLLGVRSPDGQLVAASKLRSDGRTAQVEDVYTAPESRGRGFGRAVVARGVEIARDEGNDVVFITADDNDWPKQLYARLGFRPLGRMWQFHHD
ncbi:MAG TPA: GNAT family N-acetyltransferase [Solirubrobacteraceae bacterium]|nr:GNAT family N-acetyltransferase [Solirubrobacteraceae bacterium]